MSSEVAIDEPIPDEETVSFNASHAKQAVAQTARLNNRHNIDFMILLADLIRPLFF
jgi:hypothetical protein